MNNLPTVIVKKGGFLSAIVYGVFGFATTTVICATGLGLFGLHQAGKVLELGVGAMANLPEWLDRSASDYRDQLDLKAKIVPAKNGHRDRVVIDVHNRGQETISALALRLVFKDASGTPIREVRSYAATPIMLPNVDDWRGPLLAGNDTEYSEFVALDGVADDVKIEVADIRIATGKHERILTTMRTDD